MQRHGCPIGAFFGKTARIVPLREIRGRVPEPERDPVMFPYDPIT